MRQVVIIDYGMGNIRSVQKALQRISIDALVSSDRNAILNADKLILPGVGHFKNGMERLNSMGLTDVLNKKIKIEKTPVLGICLGMQLFTKYSEEGDCEGLGYIDAFTVKFRKTDERYKIPHMGWNNVSFSKDSLFRDEMFSNETYYFVHSYHLECTDKNDIIGTTDFGYTFTSAINRENITGVQFHPEKSFKAGLNILKTFCS